jgi:hypothetical protein
MAEKRLEKVGEVYWGPRRRGAENELKRAYTDWPLILESVFKDYALVGKEAIDKIKVRAQKKLREKYASKS